MIIFAGSDACLKGSSLLQLSQQPPQLPPPKLLFITHLGRFGEASPAGGAECLGLPAVLLWLGNSDASVTLSACCPPVAPSSG